MQRHSVCDILSLTWCWWMKRRKSSATRVHWRQWYQIPLCWDLSDIADLTASWMYSIGLLERTVSKFPPHKIRLYCATANIHARYCYRNPSIRLFVRTSNVCTVIKRKKVLPTFFSYHMKDQSSLFSEKKNAWQPLVPEILGQTCQFLQKCWSIDVYS